MEIKTPDLSFLLSNSDVLLCQLDKNLSVTYLSPRWQSHLTTLNRNVTGNSFEQLIHESDQAFVIHTIETAFKAPDSDLNFRFRPTSYNSGVRFKCHGKIVCQSNARVLILVAIDETKLSQLQYDTKYHLPSDSLAIITPNLGYWQLDVHTQELTWSDEVFQMHGVNKDHYIPTLESSLQFYHEDDVDTVQHHLSSALTTGIGWKCNFRILEANGELHFIISQGTVHRDTAGNVDAVFGVLQDITEHRELKKELDMLGFAVNNTTVGITITDSNRNVLWINDAFERLSGFSYKEMAGKNLASFLQGPDTNHATVQRIKEALNAGKSVDERILNYHKSGSIYWNNLIITPVFENQKLTHFVGIQHNITAEVESKLKLEHVNSSLEQMVKERTVALEKANQELSYLVKKDPLTGAFNRRAYYEQMDIEIKRSSRLKKALSIALIDVDFFKIINDEHGHSAGDKVLISLVKLMTSKKRELDYLFRIGGEEFLLLMPCTSNKEALIVTERIRHGIENMKIQYEKTKMAVTVSIGLITEVQPELGEDYLKKVDRYLYQAKANGRNQIAVTGSSPV